MRFPNPTAWWTFKNHLSPPLSSLQTNPVLIQLVQVQSVPFNCKSGWYSHGRDKQGMYKKSNSYCNERKSGGGGEQLIRKRTYVAKLQEPWGYANERDLPQELLFFLCRPCCSDKSCVEETQWGLACVSMPLFCWRVINYSSQRTHSTDPPLTILED